MKIYVAGPMSDTPGFNYAAFDEASETLRNYGFGVVSPAEKDKERDPEAYERACHSLDGKFEPNMTGGLTWAEIIAMDIVIVSDEVDAIALLPGWEKSNGARLEVFVGLLRKKQFGLYSDGVIHFVDADFIRSSLKNNMP